MHFKIIKINFKIHFIEKNLLKVANITKKISYNNIYIKTVKINLSIFIVLVNMKN